MDWSAPAHHLLPFVYLWLFFSLLISSLSTSFTCAPMPQQRLCFCWKPDCVCSVSRRTSFQDLPVHLRYRIFDDAAELEAGTILSVSSSKPQRWRWTQPLPSCLIELGLVSRAWYEDITTLLWSIYPVEVNQSLGSTLLHDICSKHQNLLASAPVLILDLIPNNHPPWYHASQSGSPFDQRPMISDINHHELLMWGKTVDLIATRPTRFELVVRSRICNLELLRQILEPLKRVRALSCIISLTEDTFSRDPDLRRIVKDTVEVVMGHPIDPTAAFRFFDLPQELRRNILRFTDLCTPLKQVRWDPNHGFRPIFSLWTCRSSYPFDRAHRCPAHWSCRDKESSSRGCCSRFDAVWPPCPCWMFPTSLLRTSRQLREESLAVLYGCNRILVDCPNPVLTSQPSHTLTRPLLRFGLCELLTNRLSSDALPHLRHLAVVFPHFELNRDQDDDDADYLARRGQSFLFSPDASLYEDWYQSICELKAHVCFRKLDVRIYMMDQYLSPQNQNHRALELEEQAPVTFETYRRLLKPFALVGTFRSFYVFVAKVRDSFICGPVFDGQWTETSERNFELEEHMERLVLGDDCDRERAGKAQVPDSQVLEACKGYLRGHYICSDGCPNYFD